MTSPQVDLTAGFAADGRYKIRKKLHKSMQSVAHMQEQVQHAMDWLCQVYNISMEDAMRCSHAAMSHVHPELMPALGLF